MGKRKEKPKTTHMLRLTGVSSREVINTHFGGITTILDFNDEYARVSLTENVQVDKKHVGLDAIEDSRDIELGDLLHESDKTGRRALYFLDSKKTKVKLWPIMIDTTQNGCLPLYTSRPCHNCHHAFDSHPIGCPIRYNPNLKTKNGVKYERVTTFLRENNLSTDTNDFFETENIFCSWPCVKSYIFSCLAINPHSHKYKNSLSYMMLMYKKIHGITGVLPVIPSAAPLGVLDTYGGHLSIEEYRAALGVLKYDETLNSRRPYMFSCSAYIEETRVHV